MLRMLSDFLTEDVFKEGLQVSWGLPGCVVVQVAVAGGPSLGLHGGPLPPPTQLCLCSPAVLPPRFILQ